MASMLYSHLPQVVGVVGAGQMGSGIAQICAMKGLDVIISDRSTGELHKGATGALSASLAKRRPAALNAAAATAHADADGTTPGAPAGRAAAAHPTPQLSRP
jgi:3-hydroxyacyl-CoA dehydrogenase